MFLTSVFRGIWITRIYTGVCEKNTPRENDAHWNVSLQSTRSGAGEQFLLLDCRARACAEGLFFSQTPVSPLSASPPREGLGSFLQIGLRTLLFARRLRRHAELASSLPGDLEPPARGPHGALSGTKAIMKELPVSVICEKTSPFT